MSEMHKITTIIIHQKKTEVVYNEFAEGKDKPPTIDSNERSCLL